MKGVINIEFFVSVAIFLSTIFFIVMSIVNSIPQFHNEAVLSSLRAKTFGASQILLLDEGSPRNWQTRPLSAVNRFGFSTSRKYIISRAKIDRLAVLCTPGNYPAIRNILVGDPNLIVTINVTDLETGTQYLYCSPTAATLVFPKSSVKRYAVLDTNGNRVSIQVDVT